MLCKVFLLRIQPSWAEAFLFLFPPTPILVKGHPRKEIKGGKDSFWLLLLWVSIHHGREAMTVATVLPVQPVAAASHIMADLREREERDLRQEPEENLRSFPSDPLVHKGLRTSQRSHLSWAKYSNMTVRKSSALKNRGQPHTSKWVTVC